jgi:hypothetical protein
MGSGEVVRPGQVQHGLGQWRRLDYRRMGGVRKRFFGYIFATAKNQARIFDMVHAAFLKTLAKHPVIGKFITPGLNRMANVMPGGSMAAEMDRLIRVNFIEGFMGLRPNSLVNRTTQVLARMSSAMASPEPESNPYVAAMLEHGETLGNLQAVFSQPNSGLYASWIPAVLKRAPKSARIGADDLVSAMIAGLDPRTNEPLSRTQGKPLFWHIGQRFSVNPVPHGRLRGRIFQYATLSAARIMLDLTRYDARTVSMDETYGDSKSLGDMISDEVPEFDFQAVLENPEFQRLLEAGVLGRIEHRAQNAHGLSDSERRKSIEIAIWNVIKTDPDEVIIGVGDDMTFSVKQNELARRVEGLTGYPVNPMIVGRLFREHVGEDMKRVLSSGAVRRIVERESDVARTYLSGRRRMASRVAKRFAARGL